MVVVFLNFRYKFYRSFFFLIMARWLVSGHLFQKHMKLTSSLITKTYFWNFLTFITWRVCIGETKISVCMHQKKPPSCIQEKKLKVRFCVWTRMSWPRISECTFSSKISHNSWKTAQLSKMLWNDVPPTVQWFESKALSPEFPGNVSSLSLLEAPSLFREYLIFFYLIFEP